MPHSTSSLADTLESLLLNHWPENPTSVGPHIATSFLIATQSELTKNEHQLLNDPLCCSFIFKLSTHFLDLIDSLQKTPITSHHHAEIFVAHGHHLLETMIELSQRLSLESKHLALDLFMSASQTALTQIYSDPSPLSQKLLAFAIIWSEQALRLAYADTHNEKKLHLPTWVPNTAYIFRRSYADVWHGSNPEPLLTLAANFHQTAMDGLTALASLDLWGMGPSVSSTPSALDLAQLIKDNEWISCQMNLLKNAHTSLNDCLVVSDHALHRLGQMAIRTPHGMTHVLQLAQHLNQGLSSLRLKYSKPKTNTYSGDSRPLSHSRAIIVFLGGALHTAPGQSQRDSNGMTLAGYLNAALSNLAELLVVNPSFRDGSLHTEHHAYSLIEQEILSALQTSHEGAMLLAPKINLDLLGATPKIQSALEKSEITLSCPSIPFNPPTSRPRL